MLRDQVVDLPARGVALHVRHADGAEPWFLLTHGLSSNCMTWEAVAIALHSAGFGVTTLDLRGHGLSSKTESGYTCPEVAADVAALISDQRMPRPIFCGQSWGGNVALCLGAEYPDLVSGLGLIDGGFISLRTAFTGGWQEARERLTPPPLKGRPVQEMRRRMQENHPDWSADAVEHTLANFSVDAQDRVAPWLSLKNHMQVLRGLWDMDPCEYAPQVEAPTLICVAERSGDDRGHTRRIQVERTAALLRCSKTTWFPETDHDIHVHRPGRLAELLLEEARSGIWARR